MMNARRTCSTEGRTTPTHPLSHRPHAGAPRYSQRRPAAHFGCCVPPAVGAAQERICKAHRRRLQCDVPGEGGLGVSAYARGAWHGGRAGVGWCGLVWGGRAEGLRGTAKAGHLLCVSLLGHGGVVKEGRERRGREGGITACVLFLPFFPWRQARIAQSDYRLRAIANWCDGWWPELSLQLVEVYACADTFYAVTPHTPHTWFTRTPVVRSFNHLFQKLDSVELPGDIVFESLSYFGLYGENVTVTARTPAAAPTNRVIINASIVNPTAGGSGGSGGDGGSLTGWQIALIVIACVAATAAVAAALALLVLRRRGAAARRAAYTGVTSKCSDHSTDGALPPAAAGDRKYGVGKSADGPLAGSGYTHASSLDTAMTASTAGSGDATAAPALRAAAKPVSAATAAAGSVAVPPPSGAPEAPCGETPKREGTDSLLQRIFQSEESLRAPLSSSSSLSDADGIGGSMAPPVLASNAGGSNGAAGGGGSGSGGSAGTSAGGPPREQRAVIARQLAALTEEYGGPATPAQWQVHGQLGRGAFGVVYRGTWRGLEVAIKRVLFQVMTNAGEERDRRQALREAAINATLDHANIVPTYT
eukprot:365736-Chlamydomonas_euryale.AAC.15